MAATAHIEKNRRIIIVAGTVKMGGAERVLTYLVNHWVKQGHAVSLLTFDGADVQPFFPLDPRVTYLPLGRPARPIHARSIRSFFYAARQIVQVRRVIRQRLLLSRSPSQIISISAYYNMIMILATMLLPVRKIVTDHTWPGRDSFFLRLLRPVLYSFSDLIVVLTKSTYDYFPQRLQKKISVIPNPAIALAVNGSAEDAVKPDRPYMLGVGRLVPQKRFDLLVAAFTRIAGEFPEWDLKIAGSGPLESVLRKQINDLGLNHRVQLLGAVTSIFDVYVRAGLFVLSSDYEGFAMVVCEAMASGLPVIATDCPVGPSDIIQDRVDGWLIKSGDAQELAHAMKILLSDPALRERLGRNATSVTEKFKAERFFSDWESALTN